MTAKNTPNPNGRKGSPEHQEKVNEVAEGIRERKLNVVFEYFVRLIGKRKKSRFADVAALNDEKKLIELHQIGKQNKNGTPVKRERDAMDDIENAEGIRPDFHPFDQ